MKPTSRNLTLPKLESLFGVASKLKSSLLLIPELTEANLYSGAIVMFSEFSNARVYLALGNTDMRKAINGLSILVEESLDLDLFSGHLFVFCNRKRTIVKILYWDINGFCLWQKRLEKHSFKWPESTEQIREIGLRELRWLLDGLEIHQQAAHNKLTYTTVY